MKSFNLLISLLCVGLAPGALTSAQQAIDLTEGGRIEFLQKPVSGAVLCGRVREILDNKGNSKRPALGQIVW